MLVVTAAAQQAADLKLANEAYTGKDYYRAITLYEKYLGIGQKSKAGFYSYAGQKMVAGTKSIGTTEIYYRLAESYRLLNDDAKAAPWYAKTLQGNTNPPALARYYYGTTLRATKQFQEAESELKQFLNTYTQQDAYRAAAVQELDNLVFIQQQLKGKKQELYSIGKLHNSSFKTDGYYAPAIAGNSLYFTASLNDTATKRATPFVNQLYAGTLTDTSIAGVQPVAFSDMAKAAYHQGAASFTANGKKMFFTRWGESNGKPFTAIYSSEAINGKWSAPVKLNTNVNIEGYNNKQPFVTQDGSLLIFSSDRPGGLGKYDLWYCTIDATGNAGTAINLGSSVNTSMNETAPFYNTAAQTLVFASDGRTGMGGYDLYSAKGNLLQWQQPKNLGYPINSTKNDVYFYSNAQGGLLQNAYFSSDRASGCCLELFTVSRQNNVTAQNITGKLTDCVTGNPLTNVQVTLNQQNQSIPTGNAGHYSFNISRLTATQFSLQYSKEGYNNAQSSLEVAAESRDYDTVFTVNACLTPLQPVTPVTPPAVIEEKKNTLPAAVYFEFDKAFFATAEVPALDSLADILLNDKTLSLEINGYTDGKGSNDYNIKLSLERAKACAAYLTAKGISTERLRIKPYGECCPVAPDTLGSNKDNPEGRMQNRRVEFKIVK